MIRAGERVELVDSAISTEATAGAGGNIAIEAQDRLHLVRSAIAASATSGSGGNVGIEPHVVLLEEGSRIVAQAVDGSGGNIALTADVLLVSPESLIDEIEGNRHFRTGLSAPVSRARRRSATRRELARGAHADPPAGSPHSTPNAALGPGPTRGEASLRVHVEEERPYHLWLEGSNYESPRVGSARARIRAIHDNLTGNGEPVHRQPAVVGEQEALVEEAPARLPCLARSGCAV